MAEGGARCRHKASTPSEVIEEHSVRRTTRSGRGVEGGARRRLEGAVGHERCGEVDLLEPVRGEHQGELDAGSPVKPDRWSLVRLEARRRLRAVRARAVSIPLSMREPRQVRERSARRGRGIRRRSASGWPSPSSSRA